MAKSHHKVGGSLRLYFHLADKRNVIPDETGVEVTDIEQAQAAAFAMLQELREEDAIAAKDWSGWTLNATDEDGRIVFSIELDSRLL